MPIGSAVFIVAMLSTSPAFAQPTPAYPTRSVQFVVPFTPGTGADILARLLGPKLTDRWKVAMVTDNRAGASGNIGAEHVAKAAPDGHTLLFTATTFSTNPAVNKKLPFDPVKSFAPVALVATSVMALVVAPQVPAGSIGEFLEYVRRQPGRLHYASPGTGGVQHFAMELFKIDARLDMVHVPYKGMGGALADLVGGHVQASIISTQTIAPYVQQGKLKMLAVLSAERSPAFPDVPTFKENGLPTMQVDTWYALFAPAGTPVAVVDKINREIDAIVREPEVREVLAKQGLIPAGGPPERLARQVALELERWTRVAQTAGIRAE
jgi:tripartite-type tricarboxylate transporter receptor subunit TctC